MKAVEVQVHSVGKSKMKIRLFVRDLYNGLLLFFFPVVDQGAFFETAHVSRAVNVKIKEALLLDPVQQGKNG